VRVLKPNTKAARDDPHQPKPKQMRRESNGIVPTQDRVVRCPNRRLRSEKRTLT